MLNKYEEFFKISKHDECSIYTAASRQTGQPVLLKRFKNKLTWDEVLKNKNMQFSQRSKMFPKMIEIFKNKQDFYIVYERPTHSSLQQAQDIGPLSLQNYYILFHDLCQHLITLKSNVPGVYVIPDWIFMHRHTVKIVHYQPFFLSKEALSSDHVYLYKVENQILPEDKDDESNSTIVPGSKRRNLVFNLGMISYHLLTGMKHDTPETQDDYLAMVTQISQNAQRRILKATKDKQLAQMVEKMLSKNIFEIPQLETVANMMQYKAAAITPKKRSHATNIEIDIEHIKLENSRDREEVDFRRRLRPCCIEKESSLEKIKQEIRMSKEIRQQKEKEYKQLQGRKVNMQNWQKETPRIAKSSKKTILPQIKPSSRRRMKTEADLMNTTNSKPLMFNNRSLLF